ncbi:hypothetical protein BASA83_013557, partial [Batrachochytrium salamandrivorans]
MPYGLQSDEDSQLASILERLQLLEAGKREPQAKHFPGPVPGSVPATGGTPTHSPTTAPISPGAIRVPARQVQRNRLNCAPFSTSWSWCFYQPQPIQLGGNQGGHSRDPLNR